MPISLAAIFIGVFILPAGTLAFARIFWNSKWQDRMKNSVLVIAWGAVHLVWFVGALILLPVWYLRFVYDSPPPTWCLLFPFLSSIGALVCFSRQRFKVAAHILEARTSGQISKEKSSARMLVEALGLFSFSACLIATILWFFGKISNWNDLGKFSPIFAILAVLAVIQCVSQILKKRKWQ